MAEAEVQRRRLVPRRPLPESLSRNSTDLRGVEPEIGLEQQRLPRSTSRQEYKKHRLALRLALAASHAAAASEEPGDGRAASSGQVD